MYSTYSNRYRFKIIPRKIWFNKTAFIQIPFLFNYKQLKAKLLQSSVAMLCILFNIEIAKMHHILYI